MKYLIIQYCDNDYPENEAFNGKDSLNITPESVYNREVEKHKHEYAYYPGKHVHGLLRLLNRLVKDRIEEWRYPPPPRTPEGEANAFLYALTHSDVDLSSVKVVVLEINGWASNDDSFIHALAHEKQKEKYPEYVLKIQELDLSSELTDNRYFPLDGHLTPEGHRIVAERLLQLLPRSPD